MNCPECGADGSTGTRKDYLHGGFEVTHFWCDDADEHHFLIYKLPPYETITMEEHLTPNQKVKPKPDNVEQCWGFGMPCATEDCLLYTSPSPRDRS